MAENWNSGLSYPVHIWYHWIKNFVCQLFCWKMTSQDFYSNKNLHFYLKWNIRNIKGCKSPTFKKLNELIQYICLRKIHFEIKPPFVASIDFLAPQGEWPLVSSSWDLGGLYLLQKYYMFDEKKGPICKSQRVSKSIFDRAAKFQRNFQKQDYFLAYFCFFTIGDFKKDTFWKLPTCTKLWELHKKWHLTFILQNQLHRECSLQRFYCTSTAL